MQRVPPMPGGLTPEWLTEVLVAQGVLAADNAVTAVASEQVGDGVGMMSELARLALSYRKQCNAPASMVAKFASQNATNRQVSMDFHVYEREVRYFQELDARTELVSPSIFYVAIEGDMFVILMADLSAYRCGDQAVGATLFETELAVDALVSLHAPFWDDTESLDWVPGVADSYHADNMYNFVQAGWPVMMEHFGEFVDDTIDQQCEAFFAAARGLQAGMYRGPRTLLHGDYRMENFFYGEQPEQHKFVVFDFQGPLRGCGMVDVALMLGQSTKKEVRAEHEQVLVARYAAGLRARGITYSNEQAWQDYLDALLYNWLYTGVVAGTLDTSNPLSYAWMAQMIDRQNAATMAHNLFDKIG